jgi:preprotein translocase subunit SecE
MEDFNFTTPDFGSNPIEYLKDAKAELKKVKWPTKKQAINSTILVIIVTIATGAFLGALDYGFSQVFAYLLK